MKDREFKPIKGDAPTCTACGHPKEDGRRRWCDECTRLQRQEAQRKPREMA